MLRQDPLPAHWGPLETDWVKGESDQFTDGAQSPSALHPELKQKKKKAENKREAL